MGFGMGGHNMAPGTASVPYTTTYDATAGGTIHSISGSAAYSNKSHEVS